MAQAYSASPRLVARMAVMFKGLSGDFGSVGQEVVGRQLQDRIEAALEADRGARATAHAFAARSLEVSGEDFEVVLELQQSADGLVLRTRAVGAAEIGPADVAYEQRVAAQDERRHRAARRIGDAASTSTLADGQACGRSRRCSCPRCSCWPSVSGLKGSGHRLTHAARCARQWPGPVRGCPRRGRRAGACRRRR